MSILKVLNKTSKKNIPEIIDLRKEIERKILPKLIQDDDIEDDLLEATKLVEDSFNLVKYCGEVYFMIPCIILAFLLNCVALYLWYKNKLVDKTLKYFIVILVILDQFYLASLVPYLAFRPRGSDAAFFNGSYQRGDFKNNNFVVETPVISNVSNLKALIDPYIDFSNPSNTTFNFFVDSNFSYKPEEITLKGFFKRSINETINVGAYNSTKFDINITTHKKNIDLYNESSLTHSKNFTEFEGNIKNDENLVNYTIDPYITYSLEMLKEDYRGNTIHEELFNTASNSKNRSTKTIKSPIEIIKDYYFVHYLSVIVGTSQCTSAWLLYLAAVEADSSVRNVVFGARTTPYISKLFPFVIFLLSSFYFSIFLPEIRYLVVDFVNLMYNDFEITNRTYNSINTMYNVSQSTNASANEANSNGGPFKHQSDLMPFQNHWDFVLNEVPKNDYFYIIFFSLLYIVSTYVIPYCLLVCKDKNLIDALHASQKVELSTLKERLKKEKELKRERKRQERLEKLNNENNETTEKACLMAEGIKYNRDKRKSKKVMKIPPVKAPTKPTKQWHHFRLKPKEKSVISDDRRVRHSLLYASATVSATCNVYLVCVALKMVILTFKLFEYLHDYTSDSQVFFQYLNIYSNFIQVLKCTTHLPLLAFYNVEMRRAIIKKLPNIKAIAKKIKKYM